jgi:hypothetical protein
MSEPQAGPATGLLARKGCAAPAGAVSDPALALAAVPDCDALSEAGAPAQAGKPKPASQLPIDFMTGRQGAREWAPRPADQPEAAPQPADQPEAAPRPLSVVESGSQRPEPAVPELFAKPEGPRLDPALRIDTGLNSTARAERRRFLGLVAGLVLVLAAAGYGYQSGWFESEPQAPASASPAPAQIDPAQNQSEVAKSSLVPPAAVPESGPGIEVNQPSVDVVTIEPGGVAVIAGRAPPGTELILLDNGAPIGTTQADSYGEWVFISIEPLPDGAHDFGLVIKKIEGGASVPSLEKKPAAKETAAPGVRKSNEPGTVAGAAAAVSIPPRKPDTRIKQATAGPLPFAVQLASVKTRAGAEREWRALRDRFPEILAGQTHSFEKAKLAGGETVVRLRTGGFVNRAEADALCARLAAKNRNCLVVRTGANR